MKRFKFMSRLLPLLAMISLVLTACGEPDQSVLIPKGPVADEQLFLIKISFWVMIFVLAVVFAIYFYVIVKFRKKAGDNSIPKQVEGNHVYEMIWTIIPIILLLVLAVPTIQYTFKHATDYTKSKDAVQIVVTGHQFWWQFQYPEHDINTAQELVIPVGKTIAFRISASDVTHSFWVPSLGGKIDANPGDKNVNVLYLKADNLGIYKGKCAELCGASHALMDFKVRAVSPEEYTQWIASMKAPNPTSVASASVGETLFKGNCISCHAVDSRVLGKYPNLDGFASRTKVAGILDNTAQNQFNWISNPQAIKPGTLMPQVIDESTKQPLAPDKVAEIVKYLDTLKLK